MADPENLERIITSHQLNTLNFANVIEKQTDD